MKQFQYGLIRNATLAENHLDRESLTLEFSYIKSSIQTHEHFNVVAVLNRTYPLFQLDHKDELWVYDHANAQSPVTKVANSQKQLVEILEMYQLFWSNESSVGISKNKDTIKMRDDFLEMIREADNTVNVDFWDDLFFRELNIGLIL